MIHDTLLQVLDLARWAPSGDNTQPWRFEIVDERTVRVHGFDTRDQVLYDFDGHPSHIAHGALLETMRIAATGFSLATSWVTRSEGEHRSPVYEVRFTDEPGIQRDPLFDCIETRTVQRRPMKTTPLTAEQRDALESACGNAYRVKYFESTSDRLKVAALLWGTAKIRLTCPEAYKVHKEVIEWRARFSKDRIPDQAVGVDFATARLMEWVMQSWQRVQFFNRYLFGTVVPRIQLDLFPALGCAAHLLVQPRQPPRQLEDWVQLGVVWQRMWLTATRLGLHLQPQMTPIIFRWYANANRSFSTDPTIFKLALRSSTNFEKLAGASPSDPFGFFVRVGVSRKPWSRSLRQDLQALLK